MFNKMMLQLAVFFGAGKMPKAPGTWGSVAAIPLAWALSKTPPLIWMGLTLLVILLGIFAAEVYERTYGSHDASEIVIDEVAGILVTMMWIPMTWQSLIIGFFLFRLFDIWKPFPISALDQKIPGGVGVMADDLAAGIFANLILQILFVQTQILGVQWLGGIGLGR